MESLIFCQEFINYNPMSLPSPIHWVNIKKIRVKDSLLEFGGCQKIKN